MRPFQQLGGIGLGAYQAGVYEALARASRRHLGSCRYDLLARPGRGALEFTMAAKCCCIG
jgi:hypothetical protein